MHVSLCYYLLPHFLIFLSIIINKYGFSGNYIKFRRFLFKNTGIPASPGENPDKLFPDFYRKEQWSIHKTFVPRSWGFQKVHIILVGGNRIFLMFFFFFFFENIQTILRIQSNQGFNYSKDSNTTIASSLRELQR